MNQNLFNVMFFTNYGSTKQQICKELFQAKYIKIMRLIKLMYCLEEMLQNI